MKKITFKTVDKWARLANEPLKNELLENFQQSYFGDFRHKYYRFFYHMVKQTKPLLAVELGIDHGHTIVHMAAANSDTRVIGIDKNMQCGDGNVYRRFLNCEVYYLNSLDTDDLMSHFVGEYGLIGVVFQDTSHKPDESLAEFEIYNKYLDDNAIWVVDDVIDTNEGMGKYFAGLPGRKHLYNNLHHETVMGVALI